MNDKKSPWITLAENSFYKDIDENFLKAVDAIDFFTPANNKNLQETFEKEIYLGHEKESEYRNDKIVEVPKYIQYKERYNFADFLILKLIENFRRIYAVDNKEKQDNKGTDYFARMIEDNLIDNRLNPTHIEKYSNKKTLKDQLLSQQDMIYQVFDKLKDKLFFSSEEKMYPRSIVGKNYKIKSFELMCYLGLHESLDEKNIPQHLLAVQSSSQNFANPKSLNIFEVLGFSYSKSIFLEELLKKSDEKELIESYSNSSKKNKCYHLPVMRVLMKAKIPHDTFKSILICVLNENLYKSIPLQNKEEFTNDLEKFVGSKDISFLINKRVLSIYNEQDFTYNWALKKTKTLDNPHLLSKVIGNDKLASRSELLALYSPKDITIFKECVDIIYDKKDCQNLTARLLEHYQDNLSHEDLAYVVGKNVELFSVIKPIYLKEKLNNSLEITKEKEYTVKKKI